MIPCAQMGISLGYTPRSEITGEQHMNILCCLITLPVIMLIFAFTLTLMDVTCTELYLVISCY